MTSLIATLSEASRRAYELSAELNLARATATIGSDMDSARYVARARDQLRQINGLFARLRIAPLPATRGQPDAPASSPRAGASLTTTEAS